MLQGLRGPYFTEDVMPFNLNSARILVRTEAMLSSMAATALAYR